MYVIGERVNGTTPKVKNAIQQKDKDFLQDLIRRQEAAGANAIDLNVGPAVPDRKAGMLWLVGIAREVTNLPLSIDSAKWDIIRDVVPQVPGDVIINSTKADPEIAAQYAALAVECNASLVGITLDASGVPSDPDKRVELGAQLIATAMEAGLPLERLFIDPIILPVNASPNTPPACLQSMRQIKVLSDTPPPLMLGLSNVSQKCNNRELINRTYMSMCIAAGLDGVIMDPLDTELMDTVIAAEMLLGKTIYCDSFLEAARRK